MSVIQGSSFTGNQASNGGAIYTEGNLTTEGSTFSNNTAALFGGAVYTGHASTVTLITNTFRDNKATLAGPAILSAAAQPLEQVSYRDNRACGNIVPAYDVGCNGISFFVGSDDGTPTCAGFGRGCADPTAAPTLEPTPECGFFDVLCSVERYIRQLIESIVFD